MFFTEHLWATASIWRKGRRLKQIEISIISKLTKKTIKKEKCFLFCTCCAHPFSFRASRFAKRPYISLYSYFHAKHIWIHTSKLKNFKIILKFHLGIKCLQVFFSFFDPRMKFHPGTGFIPGWNFTCKHPLNIKFLNSFMV